MALALEEDEDRPERASPPASPVHAYQALSVLAREPGRVRYLARRQDFHAFVSLEIVSRSALAGMAAAAADARIAQLRALRHPAIARILDAWVEEGDWFLVSDYVPGRALTPRGGEGIADALVIFDRIGDALAMAHAHGIMHGRLDPSIVVLVDAGAGLEPRLTGFTLCHPPPTIADDIVGLGRILVALTASHAFAAEAAALADRAAGKGPEAPFETIPAFRAAVAGLRT